MGSWALGKHLPWKEGRRLTVTPQLSWLRADGQQRLYVFQGNQFWEVTADGNVSEPRPLRERWAGLPPHIEAAAVSLEDGDFYFFKGTSPGAEEEIES